MDAKAYKAAALSYNPSKGAPIIVAEGKGYVAEKILEEAIKHDIPVYKDPKLATLLTELELGDEIPESLYDVMAQILIFVSDVDELYAKLHR